MSIKYKYVIAGLLIALTLITLSAFNINKSDSSSDDLLTPVEAPSENYSKVYEDIPTWVLSECTAIPNQSKQEFIAQVASHALSWTEAIGFEVCGVVGEDSQGKLSVILSTNKSQTGCIFVDELVMEGSARTQDQIHTHPYIPDGGELFLNEDTHNFNKKIGVITDNHSVVIKSPDEFSKVDILNG